MIIDHVVRWFSPMWRGRRVVAGVTAAATVATGVIIGWDHAGDRAPQVRLQSGVAWVASDETGQLTLLDGASAAVAGQVQVGQPGTDLDAVQQGTTGYALNRTMGSVVRVDGATLELSRPLAPVTGPGAQLSVFPTPHALYTLDTTRGLLAKADPETLESRGEPHQLTGGASVDGAMTDADGHLWALDRTSGELVWFSDGTRHSRPEAHTPGKSKLTHTADGPAVVDWARGTVELLDPKTGLVQESVKVPLRPDDTVAVSGSPHDRRLLVAVGSRGQFLSCSFDTDACSDPVELSRGAADLGEPVEADGHAVVPDYATGRVWVIDLAAHRVVAERRLFERPGRFELLSRDGVVFYNDPSGEQAGVVDLDGRVRPITKYKAGQRTQAPSSGPATSGPAATAPVSNAPPATGPGAGTPPRGPRPGTQSAPAISIAISPRNRGLVGDEFQFTVTARGAAGLASPQWTFGDGAGATGLMVRHRYTRAGTYAVAVGARSRQGQSVNASAQVVVDALDAPPRIERITVEPETPRVGEQVRFSAELAGGRPQSTTWTVTADGSTQATSNQPVFHHVFTRPGTYTATHTVTAGVHTVQQSKQFTVTPETREVRCGDVIREDTVLTKDLQCTGDVGLKIAASDVVLDLGGHKIATDNPQAPRKGIVVAATEPIRDITIRNGTISQFQTGVEMIDVSDVTIANATLVGSSVRPADEVFGLVGVKAHNVRMLSTTLRSFNPFLFDNGSTAAFVGSSIVGDEGWGGAYCRGNSSCLLAERTDVQTRYLNCGGAEPDSSTFRIDSSEVVLVEFFGAACAETVVTNNLVRGLINVDGDKNFVSKNVMDRNPTMVVRGEFVVADNEFIGAGSKGLNIEEHWLNGIKGEVLRNRIVGSGGYGLHVQQFVMETPAGSLRISENEFISNGLNPEYPEFGYDGLRIEELTPGTHVEVSDNRAENNGEYGMIAPAGTVTVDVRNTASGNPKGCLNIAC